MKPNQAQTDDTVVHVERNVRIPLRTGGYVSADIFRPVGETSECMPVLVSMGVYGKDVPFRIFNPKGWERSELKSGEAERDLSVGETPLPDYWVEAGYAYVRCDQPGSGDSPGELDVFGPEVQEAFYDAIEWAGTQSWSNGKVGILGASYYGVMAWLVAAKKPPHLAAILPFQGFTDHYRDCIRHGGILTAGFVDGWYSRQVLPRQYGAQEGTSEEKLTSEELGAHTVFPKDYRAYLRDDELRYANHEYYVQRTPDVSLIEVPMYVWANDDGFGLHLRGTIDGFNQASCTAFKALRVYDGSEPDSMYKKTFSACHRRFFDRFLKDDLNGFDHDRKVQVTVRKNGVPHVERFGDQYPLEGVRAKFLYLDANKIGLIAHPPAEASKISYRNGPEPEGLVARALETAAALFSRSDEEKSHARFCTAELDQDLELVGPMRLHLTLSLEGSDADLFIAVREIRPDGSEVTTPMGTPMSLGWQRVSMRNEDAERDDTFRVWHTYDRSLPTESGSPVAVDVNIWPAAWIVSAGNRMVIDISGGDQKGSGEYTHPPHGPFAEKDGTLIDNGAPVPTKVTLHLGGPDPSRIVLPVLAS